jgi:hypothetical protein
LRPPARAFQRTSPQARSMAPPPLGVIPGDDHYLALTWIVTVVMQLVCFLVAWTLQIDKVRPSTANRRTVGTLSQVSPRFPLLATPSIAADGPRGEHQLHRARAADLLLRPQVGGGLARRAARHAADNAPVRQPPGAGRIFILPVSGVGRAESASRSCGYAVFVPR